MSYLYRSVACLQACTGLLLGWVTGFTGLPLFTSVRATGEGQSEWNSVIRQGTPVETIFLGRPVRGALQATSSLAYLAKNPIDCTGCPQTQFRFIKSEVSARCREASTVPVWSVCNTWNILGSPPRDKSFKQFPVPVFWVVATQPYLSGIKWGALQDTFIILSVSLAWPRGWGQTAMHQINTLP